MGGRAGIAAIGAVVALVLQLVLAPNIAFFGAMPSFLVVYSLIASMLVPGTPAYLIAFFLGMFGDLCSSGPVGVLPFILLLGAFTIEKAHEAFGNGTLFVSCIVLVVFVVVVHVLHALFMVAMPSSYTVLDAFRLVALPQSSYDCVLALLLYPALRRLFQPAQMPVGTVASGPNMR